MSQIRSRIENDQITYWEYCKKEGLCTPDFLQIGNFAKNRPHGILRHELFLNAFLYVKEGAKLLIKTEEKIPSTNGKNCFNYLYLEILNQKLLLSVANFKKDSDDFTNLQSNVGECFFKHYKQEGLEINTEKFTYEIPIDSQYFNCKKYILCSISINIKYKSEISCSFFVLNKKTSNDFIVDPTFKGALIKFGVPINFAAKFLKNLHFGCNEIDKFTKKNEIKFSNECVFAIIRTTVDKDIYCAFKKYLEIQINDEKKCLYFLPSIISGLINFKDFVSEDYIGNKFYYFENIRNYGKISITYKKKYSFLCEKTKSKALFLLDREYFFTLRDLLLAAKNKSFEKNIENNEKSTCYIDDLLLAIADNGIKVNLIMWDPGNFLSKINEFGLISTVGAKLKDSGIISNIISKRRLSKKNTKKNLQIFMEDYIVKLGSQHQKIAIIKINKRKFALVGGLNLVTPPYFDRIDHPMKNTDDNGNLNFHTWHDSAVFIEGESASQIEEEFDRRWSKSNFNAIDNNDDVYVKMAYWRFKDRSLLSSNDLIDHELKTEELKNLPIDCYVQRLITNFEGKNNITEIKDGIIKKIKTAKKHIFFENYAFHDLELIKNLAHKVKTSGDKFRALIMLPFQTCAVNDIMQTLENKIFFISFISLKILSEDWDIIILDNGKEIKKDEIEYAELYESETITNQTTKISKIKIKHKDGKTSDIKIKTIKDIYNLKDNIEEFGKIIACSPVRRVKLPKIGSKEYEAQKKFFLINQKEDLRGVFIHSKLALFDNDSAIIGSANFTKRSMNFDGEMSLLIESEDFVKSVQERLFKYDHNFNSIETIIDDMKIFLKSKELCRGIIPIKIRDLYEIKIPKFEKTIIKYLKFIVDQSDIF